MTNQSVLERLRSTQYDVVCPCLDLRVAAADEIEGAHHDITSLMDSLNGEVNAAERLRGALEEAYRLLVYARADDELYDPPTWTEECDKWLDEFAPSKLRGAVEPSEYPQGKPAATMLWVATVCTTCGGKDSERCSHCMGSGQIPMKSEGGV